MKIKISILLITLFLNLDAISQENRLETIKFKVEESKNKPFPGVTILIKGTSIGTSTDLEGEASLELENNNQTIVVSYIGPYISFKLINNIDFVYLNIEKKLVIYYKKGKKVKRQKIKLQNF
jgi:iron complex outermembrane receptor protein